MSPVTKSATIACVASSGRGICTGSVESPHAARAAAMTAVAAPRFMYDIVNCLTHLGSGCPNAGYNSRLRRVREVECRCRQGQLRHFLPDPGFECPIVTRCNQADTP